MNNNFKATLLSMFILFVAVILQSTLLELIAIGGATPDLSLIVLVFISLRKGKIPGQVSGFFSGLVEDFLSLPYPVGFSTLIKTIIGFLYGLFKGRMVLGPIFMPVIIILVATLIKFLLAILATLIFPKALGKLDFFSLRLLFELLYNCFMAPLIFALLNKFKTFKLSDKERV